MVTIHFDGKKLLATTASGFTVALDYPRGSGPTSVEWLLVALGQCIAGTMLVHAQNTGVPVQAIRLELQAVETSAPHRVREIDVRGDFAGPLSAPQCQRLQRVGAHCKLHGTLANGCTVTVRWEPPPSEGPERLGEALNPSYITPAEEKQWPEGNEFGDLTRKAKSRTDKGSSCLANGEAP